jgi:murein DD-endopeptidase MepM/ murein hydrolase activator NlpD
MNKTRLKFLLLLFTFYFLISAVQAATPQELKDSISAKSAELQNIQAERQKILDNLNELNKESATLQKDIEKNNYQISQLNLAIKSSQINIEKLGLEIESLGYEIKALEVKSDLEKEAIVKLLRELREKENENFLIILLRNQSLAESVSEAQNLLNLNNGLTLEMTNLRQLHEERSQKLDEISQKKSEQELENSNQRSRKLIVEDQKTERQSLLTLNKKQERVYQQKIQELEKIQADISAEIEEIENKLRKEIDPTILPTPRPGVLVMPLLVNLMENLTQAYGATEFAQLAYSSQFHNGIDIRASVGTPVFAAEGGRVMAVGNTDKYCPPVWYGRKKYGGSYGKYIVIQHNNNLSTLYSHLSLQLVKVGAIINRGDVIGYSGNTGFTTGPHLHFTVYANIYGAEEKLLSPIIKNSVRCGLQPYGATLNPLDYL